MPESNRAVMLRVSQFILTSVWLIPILLLVPIGEIATFIWVGSRIGAGLTVLLVLLSAAIGFWLVRWQGLATAARVQATITRGESPAVGMLEGLALLAAGILLIIPGFLTDLVAFVLLIPPLRRGIIHVFLRRLSSTASVVRQHPDAEKAGRAPLEGESRRED